MSDGLKKVAPEYPHGERAPPHEGRAIIRLTLDLKTGTVIKAVVAKSTGFTALDDAAITAFQRWTVAKRKGG